MSDVMPEARRDAIYEETVAEVAEHLHLNERTLRKAFGRWLNGPSGCVHPGLSSEYNYACYAIYRVVKLKHAARTSMAGWRRWRERAKAAGWTDASDITAPAEEDR